MNSRSHALTASSLRATAFALAATALAFTAPATPASAQEVDYHRAEMLLGWHTSPLIAGGPVVPNWINDTDRFWYRNNTGSGHEFTYVDPAGNVKRPLFDHKRVRRPSVYWSPDSRRILVQRMDQRGVEQHHYVSYTPQRTVHYSQPYALPGDSIVPLPAFHILDVGETLAADEGSDGETAARPAPANVRVVLDPLPNRL